MQGDYCQHDKTPSTGHPRSIMWYLPSIQLVLLMNSPVGCSYEAFPSVLQKWRWKPDVLPQQSFYITHVEPTVILTKNTLAKNFKT